MTELFQKFGSSLASVVGRESAMIQPLRPAYETVLGWSTFGNGIPREINGVTYRVDARYRHQLAHDYDASTVDLRRNLFVLARLVLM
jgi:hypothetical protein